MSASCLYIAALLLTTSYAMTTEVLAGSNVCYDTLQYSQDTFSPPYDGTIIGVKLVHSSGGVTCKPSVAPTNWGCAHGLFINVMKERVNTPLRIYPTPNTNGISDIRPISISNNPTCACDYWFYTIGNKDDNSAQYQIKDADNPVRVRTSDSFTLQYSEGCCGVTTSDNSGSACADVYFIYDTIKPPRAVIKPGSESSNPDIGVQIGDGRNGVVRVIGNKMFDLYGENTAEQKFPLAVRLNGDEYGFSAGAADSQLAFTLRGKKTTGLCDLFGVIAIGSRYMSFGVSLDGNFGAAPGVYHNIAVYPACGSRLARGDASGLLQTIDPLPSNDPHDLRAALAGGNYSDWYGIGDTQHNDNFPITLEISNNDVKDRFTFRFASSVYPNGVECTYKGAAPTGKNIQLYLTPDWRQAGDYEGILIRSIAINGNVYRSALTIADIFAYEMALDVAAEEAGIEDYVGEIEHDDVDYFMVENISKWRGNLGDNRYNHYVKIGGFVVLSLVVLVLIGLLYKYYFAGYDRKSKKLSSENDPLLNNINVQTK